MIEIQTDTLGQRYIEWAQAEGSPTFYKRAWIQHKADEKDWAGTGRYLNVVRIDREEAGERR